MVLEISNLGKRYGGLWALQNLNLGIGRGELRGIIGPNGAGKSTLFNLIIGRERPTTGKIIYQGRNIAGLRPDQRARLGISIKFQITNVFNGLSVSDNIRLGIAGCRRGREEGSGRNGSGSLDDRVSEILERIGLSGKSGEPAGTLSHGEKQWLEIGMALATEPTLLLLDEPTSGMGREETEKTAELIRRLRGELTILVIEHDMDFVRSVSERITVLYRGGFLTEGTYDEIKADDRVIEAYLGRGRQ
ncbi:MAG: ABC transporter ATP-binding protein [Deltaproteobacteria bacterium]|nr:ABC transporter ATP-binding protein [Deltaproteobacteria bacterium]MBW2122773.1 ABC transporter ATP-binding protein [Deltaproteobacteria bacterium]